MNARALARRPMRLRRTLTVSVGWILVGRCLLSLASAQPASECDRPEAASLVLMEASSRQALCEREPHRTLSPASFVKVLTLYLAFDALRAGKINLADLVTVSQRAGKTGGSRMFLKPGERVSVENLLKGIAAISANDACVALAEHLDGSEGAFVGRLNEKAKHLGLRESRFSNAHGLPGGEQRTSAADMAELARRYAEDYPEALAFHSLREFEHQGIPQPNRNTLLHGNLGVDGLMTGHVEEAGYHLLATAKRGDVRWIAVVMGCRSILRRNQAAAALLSHGYRNFTTLRVVRKGMPFGPFKVVRGKESRVSAVARDDGRVTVARGKEKSVTAATSVSEPIVAPIQRGQVVGKVVILREGQAVREVDLVSAEGVAKGVDTRWVLALGGMALLGLVCLVVLWKVKRRREVRRGIPMQRGR